MQKGFYITTTLPYVNADPHLGHALEFVQTDVIARYKGLTGYEVFFNTGTDEHGLKILRKAEHEGIPTEEYVNRYALRFKNLLASLNIKYDSFLRTTDQNHIRAAQEFWKRCARAGDIYPDIQEIKYCVGCELEKTESELANGLCPLHPTLAIEIRKEKNYFFRFSKYQGPLLDLYEKSPNFVVPQIRLNEVRAFVERGLRDFSISRLAAKMPWGVPVPGDTEHVMYVWFDALVSYLSAIRWPEDRYATWWPVTQFAGKDNLRQQAAMWQAMLLSAGLEPSEKIVIHGFVTSGGQKMSKTVGNVIDPFYVIKKYGADALRYYLLREVSTFEDGDFTEEHFIETYNANLANGLGNVVSRVMKMATTYGVELSDTEKKMTYYESGQAHEALDTFNLQREMDDIWSAIKSLDEDIQRSEPFKKIKRDPDEAKKDVHTMLCHLLGVALRLEPCMPDTSKEIQRLIQENKMPAEPLFKRIH